MGEIPSADGSETGARERELAGEGDRRTPRRRRTRILVYPTQYRPFVPFRVTDRLPGSLTVRLLSRPSGGRVPEISEPSDYTGYVVRMRPSPPGTPTFVYTRGSLRVGGRYRMLANAQVYSSALNLLIVTAEALRR